MNHCDCLKTVLKISRECKSQAVAICHIPESERGALTFK